MWSKMCSEFGCMINPFPWHSYQTNGEIMNGRSYLQCGHITKHLSRRSGHIIKPAGYTHISSHIHTFSFHTSRATTTAATASATNKDRTATQASIHDKTRCSLIVNKKEQQDVSGGSWRMTDDQELHGWQLTTALEQYWQQSQAQQKGNNHNQLQ